MAVGRKRSPAPPAGALPPDHAGILLPVGISSHEASWRYFGRRDRDFVYRRLYIPSLIVEYTFLFLRQAGMTGDERFLVWAGSLAEGDGFVSTVVLPAARSGYLHGEIDVDVVARVFQALDQRDLVPLAQVHSHPRGAGISDTDRERPFVAQAGFLSLIVPEFAFIPSGEVVRWGVYEYRAKGEWRTVPDDEKKDRLIIDDSIIRID